VRRGVRVSSDNAGLPTECHHAMPDPTLPPDEAAAPAAELPMSSEPAAPAPPAEPPALPFTEQPAEQAGAQPVAPPEPAPADLSPAACGARLAELFPALFAQARPLPLKLRIQADIQQRAPGVFTKKSLSGFLHRHTTSTAYLIALTQAPQRVDLDGNAAGELAPEHRSAAGEELARRRAVHETRRAAERAAQQQHQQQQRAQAQREQAAEHDARRERALLLRAFETTTLTPANFCALKGIAEDELRARLDQAWHEREARPPQERQPQPAGRETGRERRPEQQRRPRRGAPTGR